MAFDGLPKGGEAFGERCYRHDGMRLAIQLARHDAHFIETVGRGRPRQTMNERFQGLEVGRLSVPGELGPCRLDGVDPSLQTRHEGEPKLAFHRGVIRRRAHGRAFP